MGLWIDDSSYIQYDTQDDYSGDWSVIVKFMRPDLNRGGQYAICNYIYLSGTYIKGRIIYIAKDSSIRVLVADGQGGSSTAVKYNAYQAKVVNKLVVTWDSSSRTIDAWLNGGKIIDNYQVTNDCILTYRMRIAQPSFVSADKYCVYGIYYHFADYMRKLTDKEITEYFKSETIPDNYYIKLVFDREHDLSPAILNGGRWLNELAKRNLGV